MRKKKKKKSYSAVLMATVGGTEGDFTLLEFRHPNWPMLLLLSKSQS